MAKISLPVRLEYENGYIHIGIDEAKRIKKVLKFLKDCGDWVTVKEIAKTLSISKRTLDNTTGKMFGCKKMFIRKVTDNSTKYLLVADLSRFRFKREVENPANNYMTFKNRGVRIRVGYLKPTTLLKWETI